MKKIDISSPVSKRLAEVALYEKIQSEFNLYPGAWAKFIKQMCKETGVNKDQGLEIIMPLAGMIIFERLSQARCIIIGKPYQPSEEFLSAVKERKEIGGKNLVKLLERLLCCEKPRLIAKAMVSKAKAEGVNPDEMATCIFQIVCEIVTKDLYPKTIEIVKG